MRTTFVVRAYYDRGMRVLRPWYACTTAVVCVKYDDITM